MDVVGPRDGRGTVGEPIDGMGADIARRLPEAYEATARRKALDRALKSVLADRVEDHVDAVARGEIQNRFGEVLASRD